jgi:hypothetical protein
MENYFLFTEKLLFERRLITRNYGVVDYSGYLLQLNI